MKKKLLTSAVLLAFAVSSLAAFSWGGIVDNNSKMTANDDFSENRLKQSNGVYLFANTNIGQDGKLRFSAEGLYKYEFNADFKEDESTFQNILDVDLLKLSGSWAIADGKLSMSLGRFTFSDFSGSIFFQTSDGLFASYDSARFKASAYAGYTGLLNRLNVSMTESEYEEDEQIYALCPKYIPVLADFSYKVLFGSHTLGLQLAAFIPVSDDNDMKAYGTLIANGYIGTIASYEAKISLGTEKFDGLMLDTLFDVNFYVNSNIMATAGIEYVSGENGDLKPFQTLTVRSYGNAPFYNGLILPKLAAFYVKDKLYAGVTERIIVTMPEDEAKLDGFDTTVNVIYNLFSDLQLGCDAGVYICKEDKDFTSYFATIKAKLAF